MGFADVLDIDIQPHPMAPALVVRVQVKDHADSPLSLVILLLKVQCAQFRVKTAIGLVFVIGVRCRKVHREHAEKLEPWECLFVLLHHVLNIEIIEPGVGFLLPFFGHLGTQTFTALGFVFFAEGCMVQQTVFGTVFASERRKEFRAALSRFLLDGSIGAGG